MTARRRPALAVAVLAATLALASAPADALTPPPTGWTAIVLPTLGGAGGTVPTAVNDKGQVVGWSQVADGRWHAFLWDRGTMTDLTPDAQESWASDISNRGQVTGYVRASGETGDAFYWHRGRTTVVAENAYANVVNERGQVGGTVDASAPLYGANPYVWTAGTRTDLPAPPFPGARQSMRIVDLNRSGTVLGVGQYMDNRNLSYLWSDGMFTEMLDEGVALIGTDLNDRGHVAGSVPLQRSRREAALWRDGAIVRLGMLPGSVTSTAQALNDRDVVVGVSAPSPWGRGTGFVWEDGVLTPLTSTGWSDPTDVNERGQVAGALGYTLPGGGTEISQAFVWRRGELTRLGEAFQSGVEVADLSERGHVVTRGLAPDPPLRDQGVLWVPRALPW